MKKLLRHFVISFVSLYLASITAQGLVFSNGLRTLAVASLGLTVVSIFAKPIINILILPLNLVTFGIFRWVSSAIALYLVELLVKDFNVSHFYFSGFSNKWFDIPTLSFDGVLSYIGFAFILSFISSSLHWITKD